MDDSARFPRPLTHREQALLEFVLGHDFPGAPELRTQAKTTRARGYWEDLPTIVLLEVMDPDAPRASVVHPVPIEFEVDASYSPSELLLFVKEGLLDSLELVVHKDVPVDELPAPAQLGRGRLPTA